MPREGWGTGKEEVWGGRERGEIERPGEMQCGERERERKRERERQTVCSAPPWGLSIWPSLGTF
jgi:hypothetical protein